MITEHAILRKLERQPKQSASFRTLVRELGARGHEERQRLHELLADMVQRGQLTANSERFAIPKSTHRRTRNTLTGRLSMHRDGYGFVTPEDPTWREQVAGDIYVSPPNVGSAMHGDRVVVEVTAIRNDGRGEGRILRVVEREHETVVGTFHYGDRFNFVSPMDPKVGMDVMIPRGKERPPEHDMEEEQGEQRQRGSERFRDERHRVFGGEAARRDIDWNNLEGMVVNVEITEWPTATSNPRGRVVEVLGYEDDFGVDVEIIIRKHHIPHRFPIEVLEEAQDIDAVIPARELRRRRDYRHLPIITIDGETARDFDDAVFVQRTPNGDFELHVHIADVAHYVREGMAIDAEAHRRGTSVYFPDRAVPMLPVELSSDICSLRPNVDRLVMSCVMEIDNQGEVVGYEINDGIIRSAERMTYTDVNAILEGDHVLRRRYSHIAEDLERMRELAMVLNRKRVRRGSIDFDLPEPFVEFDEFGLMKAILRSERNIAHRIIEEFMLAANETVASYLEEKDVASLYRIHEKPDPKRVYEFETIAAAFGYSLGVGALPVKKFRYVDDRRPRRREGVQGRGGQRTRTVEIPEDIHITPRMYQKLTQKIAGTPEERILSYLMLRSLKQARYSEVNVGHFALAAPTYTHFTSPIRRYPDLIVHRILKEVLADSAEREERGVMVGVGPLREGEARSPWSKRQEPRYERDRRRRSDDNESESMGGPIPKEDLQWIADECSQTERRADEAERELMEWKKARFMAQHIGEEFDGMIVSVTKFGLFVELTDMFIEGLVPISTLDDDRYFFHEDTRQIIGQRSKRTFSLGDRMRVIVDRIDPVEKKINFAVVQERASRAERRHRRAR